MEFILALAIQAEWKPADDAGEIAGTVGFAGDAPKPRKIDVSRDAAAAKALPDGLVDESIKVGKGGGLASAVVYVKSGLGEFKFKAPDSSVVL